MLSRYCLAFFLAAASLTPIAVAADKPPLTHADYNIWNSATGMTVSPNGVFAVYTLTPPEGDAELIVRNLDTAKEYRVAIAGRSRSTTSSNGGDDEEPVPEADQIGRGRGSSGTTSISGSPQFTPDSKFLYFALTPTQSEIAQARKEKKKANEFPRTVVAVMDLATGKLIKRIENVQSFTIEGDGAGLLILQKSSAAAPAEPEAKPKEEPKKETAPMPKTAPPEKKAETQKKEEPKKEESKKEEPKKEEPKKTAPASRFPTGRTYLFLDLATGKQVEYTDVLEYKLSKDHKSITYAVGSKEEAKNGVYSAETLNPMSVKTIKAGAGKYYRLTWDRDEKQLAFFFDDTPPPARTTPSTPGEGSRPTRPGRPTAPTTPTTTPSTPPAPTTSDVRVYLWQKDKSAAVEVLNAKTSGLKKDWQLLDRGGLSFSDDGLKLSLSTAPIPPKTTASASDIDLDLWHWKDEAIQPMQRSRANADRNKSYRAVYYIDTKKFLHIADEDRSVSVPDYGDWGIGQSDTKYRAQTWNYPNPTDYSLVNLRTGQVKPLVNGQRGGFSSSPKGNYLAGFDGKNWYLVNVPSGKKIALTNKLKEKFFNEEFDSPSTPPPYGITGWSKDEKYIYLNDAYDIWRFAVDGSESTNITKIGRESKLQFRLSTVESPYDPNAERGSGLDAAYPWLLTVKNEKTEDTGFYRLMNANEKPKLLIMGPRRYGTPIKAKLAERFVLTVSTFSMYPDYYAADKDFNNVQKFTDINPKVHDFNWGTSEILQYQSLDGLPLKSILIKPENFDPKKKYPMMVYIYERLSSGVHNFRMPGVGTSINPTFYASNGYLVLMPDIAYEIGHPGQSSLKCVLAAIDEVADLGFLNEKAIGIQGHSWGGYQIAYMVTQTNRFKAAVSGAPVSNMTSAYGGIRWGTGLPRQFQYEKTQSRIGKNLWEAPMLYYENSPIFMADRVNTPLMMLHNDQDDAVPWYQGIEYFLALRRLNKEAYLLNYNGQPHGLRKSSAQKDYTLRMQQFFDHHLKGKPMPKWMAEGVPFLERDAEKKQWEKLFTPEKKTDESN